MSNVRCQRRLRLRGHARVEIAEGKKEKRKTEESTKTENRSSSSSAAGGMAGGNAGLCLSRYPQISDIELVPCIMRPQGAHPARSCKNRPPLSA